LHISFFGTIFAALLAKNENFTTMATVTCDTARKKTEVEVSMQEAREGKINHYESVEDMFRQIGLA